MKYYIRNRVGTIIDGITIDESAKKDFMEMMDWDEREWQRRTSEILVPNTNIPTKVNKQ